MKARIRTGTTVQISSSLVEPWICGPSAVRGRPRRRKRTMKTISPPSTSAKTSPAKIATSQYAPLMRLAFGDAGSAGPSPPFPASAEPVATSASIETTATTVRSLRGTGRRHSMGVAERTRAYLPADVDEPFEVYVNGVRQQAGTDFRRDGQTLVFSRSLAKEGQLGFWRWLSLFLGVAGTYRKNDSVDVVYRRTGQRVVATGLRLEQEE